MASRLASWDELAHLVTVHGRRRGRGSRDRPRKCRTQRGSRRPCLLPAALQSAGHRHRRHRDASGCRPPARSAFPGSTPSSGPRPRVGRCMSRPTAGASPSILSFLTALPFDVLPEWAEIRALPLEAQTGPLPRSRCAWRLVRAAYEGTYGWRGIGPQPRKPDFEALRLYEHGLAPQPVGGRRGPPAWRRPGRGDDRSGPGIGLPSAVHPGSPGHSGPRRTCWP